MTLPEYLSTHREELNAFLKSFKDPKCTYKDAAKVFEVEFRATHSPTHAKAKMVMALEGKLKNIDKYLYFDNV
jgi:hypothetical protein